MNRARALHLLAHVLNGGAVNRGDWPGLLQLAGEQLVVAQLHAPLCAIREQAPPEVWSYVAEVRRRTRARNARLAGTLGDALSALNAAGVTPVLLKGCALWAKTPPAECDRLISDLDLLVRPDEMQAAVEALVAAGFAVLGDDRQAREHDVVVLGRSSDVGAIDLHQHPPGPRGSLEIGEDDASDVVIEGGAARVLSPELQILLAAVHDQLHDAYLWRGGFELRRLLDIAQIAEGSIDWTRLSALCKSPETRAALAAELAAARFLAGADIPDAMLAGVWGRLHYWRQRMQFAWPWTNEVADAVRGAHGVSRLQRAVWRWLLRRNSQAA